MDQPNNESKCALLNVRRYPISDRTVMTLPPLRTNMFFSTVDMEVFDIDQEESMVGDPRRRLDLALLFRQDN
jgi:hypothetical protein